MTDIVDLHDHRKIWKTDTAVCAACGHKWQAVYPIGAEDVGLECPSCGAGLGNVVLNEDKSKMSPSNDIVERLRTRIHRSADETELTNEAADEIERLRKCLRYEENRFNYIGTHSEGCWSWGPRHYECAMREIERLKGVKEK